MDKLNEDNNFMYLTGALVVLLMALPLLDLVQHGLAHWVSRILVLCMWLVTHQAVDFGRWWRWFLGTILLLMVGSTAVREITQVSSMGILHLLLLLFFFGSLVYCSANRVLLRGGQIDSNKIFGGIAIYLMLGLLWSMLYLLVLEVQPEAIHGIEPGTWEDNFSQVTYFSFVTLATLGYGDISPVHPITRALAYFQAVVGTFYMAVVVASLIGARTRHGTTNS